MAIWKCDVFLTEHNWQQTFTFICVHWPSLVPEANLDSLVGSITPVIEEGENDAPVEHAVSSSDVHVEDGVQEVSGTVQAGVSEPVNVPSSEAVVGEDLMQFLSGMMPGQDDNVDPIVERAESAPTSTKTEPEPQPTFVTEAMDESIALSAEPAVQDVPPDSHILMRKIDLREVKGTALGECFYEWVDAVLKGGVYPVNRQGAMFHRVEQGMLVVSPGAFRTFISERCQFGNTNSYIHVQQGLQPLGKHIVNAKGRNVHKAHIKDSESSLNGFLFAMKPEWGERYAVNPCVVLEEGE